ncbi:MAG: RT0821/Lpp0805 family surface protein [Kiloniellales bacterium]
MKSEIALETLMAYVDGELDAEATARVEAYLRGSPEGRETVRDLREGTSLVHTAYNEALERPVPEALGRAINDAFADRAARPAAPAAGAPRMPAPGRVAMVVGACLAFLVVGAGGAYLASSLLVDREIARLEAARTADRRMVEAVVNEVLEKQLSGVTVAWQSAESGSHGSVTPVRTFKSVGGQWCREYLWTTIAGARKERRRAIACREPDGIWQKRVEMLSDS